MRLWRRGFNAVNSRLACALTIALALTQTAGAAERLKGAALTALFSDTTGEYDYGGFNAYAYTQANGDNFFDMNGAPESFGEAQNIIQTKVTIKGDQACFENGWVECWVFEKTNAPGYFVGLRASDGSLNAYTRLIGRGDMRSIKRRYNAQ